MPLVLSGDGAVGPLSATAAEQAAAEREQQRAVLLERLGLTADEIGALMGAVS